MNILPKKKWHVRTKENMARVRRDEAKAAAEEAAVAERAALADHEDRVRRLKARASTSYGPSPFEVRFCAPSSADDPTSSVTADAASKAVANAAKFVSAGFQTSSSTEHVNLFAELEEQERHNLQQGNKEHAAEKKKEFNDWESKMGIMKRFAEDTKEYSKDKYWWENIPLVRQDITDGLIGNHAKNIIPKDPQYQSPKITKVAPIMKQRILEHVGESAPTETKTAKSLLKGLEERETKGKLKELEKRLRKKLEKQILEKEKKKRRKERRAKKKKRSGSPSSSDSTESSDSVEILKPSTSKAEIRKHAKKDVNETRDEKLKELRAERLRRERAEKERVEDLLKPKKAEAKVVANLDFERSRKYNSQFNPEFAKR